MILPLDQTLLILLTLLLANLNDLFLLFQFHRQCARSLEMRRERRLVWFALVLWISWLTCTNSSELGPNDQAAVSTAIDTAQFVIDQVNEHVKAQIVTDALKISDQMDSAELLEKETKLVKVGSMVGNALKAVQGAAAIASFIFTFFMPSELDVITDLINQRFKEVNARLDRLDEKLDEMETSIKANTAFNTFLAAWIKWEYASRNGANKLSEIRKAMETKTRRIDKVKLAEEYVNYYENNNLDGNLLNLYRMASLPEDESHRNIFDRFIAEYGCDITKLSQLMILIKNIMTSAAQQKLTYRYFKGDAVRATEEFKNIQTYFFQIRRAFDGRIWHCRSNSVERAKEDANKILKEMKDSPQESTVKAIFNELKVKYPWYTWAVAAISRYRTHISDLEWRGSAYFKVEDRSDPDNVKPYYVVYQDTKSSTTCNQIKQAKTLLVFKRCDGCNNDYIYAGSNIISNNKCDSAILEQLVHLPSNLITQVWKNEIKTLGFIASGVNTIYKVCRFDTCREHGDCRQIPFTNAHQCICNRDYEGQSCEKRLEFDDSIEKMLSELRKTFTVVNGIPTAVDVFFSIRSLTQKLDAIWEKIKVSFAYTNNIIKFANIIYNVEDIADLYGKLQRNELMYDQFGQKISNYLQTVATAFELQNRLKEDDPWTRHFRHSWERYL